MRKILIEIIKFIGHNLLIFQLIQFMGLCVLSVGSYSLAGYIAHRENYYKWSTDVGMALNTSILFVVIGITFFLIAIYIRKLEGKIDELEKYN